MHETYITSLQMNESEKIQCETDKWHNSNAQHKDTNQQLKWKKQMESLEWNCESENETTNAFVNIIVIIIEKRTKTKKRNK